MVRTGIRSDIALSRVADALSAPEKYKFLMWAQRNLSGEYSKYNINQKIQNMNAELHRGTRKMRTKFASDGHYYYIPKLMPQVQPEPESKQKELVFDPADYDDQYAIDFETARNKLMSRVFAIDKLLEKYRRVIKTDQLDAVEEALGDLRKKIRKLRLASSINDSIIKTANILKKLDFAAGADALTAIAAEPTTQVVQKEFDTVPPEQREAALDEAINKLTNISAVIKNRDLVRSLAEIDLMLYRLRMSSFFPEIQEAQSKLIDAYGYASNKLEDLLPKLRGGLQTQPEIVSTEAPPEAEPQQSDKRQLGDEVKQLSTELQRPAPAKQQPAAAKPKEEAAKVQPEDEGFEDEPVSLKSIPGLE
jgi:hypothetical protein